MTKMLACGEECHRERAKGCLALRQEERRIRMDSMSGQGAREKGELFLTVTLSFEESD